MSERPVIGLQLYTLRNEMTADAFGTLKRVAELGYEGVEMGGLGNRELEKTIDVLRANNLKVVGTHVSLEALQDSVDGIIEENLLLDNKYVVCSYLPEPMHNKEGFLKAAEILSAASPRLKDAGIQLCYHNHAFEFERFDGEYGLDILYSNSDPKLVQAELDTYWVKKGGADPAAYVQKYSGRLPLLHIKDMAGDEAQSFAEVGAGILDWPAIFAAADKAGVTSYIVEQDSCPGDPFDSVRTSIENLKKMGKLG